MQRRVGILGCGLIGQKRAASLEIGEFIGCYDPDPVRVERLSSSFHVKKFSSEHELIHDPTIDTVIIATTHDQLARLTEQALYSRKSVLVEKPAGLNASEIKRLIELQSITGQSVYVGYNHRYHPGLMQAKSLVNEGIIGELMYIRAKYGHGGRLGYEQEWRANPQLSGGGELIDQGVHLIDLSRWFLGEFVFVEGVCSRFYWDMPVEDNVFMTLQTENKKLAFLHASCTEWKNTFCFEIFGKSGKLLIEGLGRSYGIETLTLYQMLPQMGPPEKTVWEFPGEDCSWKFEWEDFKQSGSGCSLKDAYHVLKIVESLYQEVKVHDHYTQSA